jgi:hypothetical protein
VTGRYRTRTDKQQSSHKVLPQNNIQQSTKNTDRASGTEYGTLSPDLAVIVRLWPGLSEHIKQAIIKLAGGAE